MFAYTLKIMHPLLIPCDIDQGASDPLSDNVDHPPTDGVDLFSTDIVDLSPSDIGSPPSYSAVTNQPWPADVSNALVLLLVHGMLQVFLHINT